MDGALKSEAGRRRLIKISRNAPTKDPYKEKRSQNNPVIAQTHTGTLFGIDALPVVVEVDLRPHGGEGTFVMVGLADKAVEESRVRVRAAISNSGFDFPNKKVICNLAPGDLRKEGPFLDLPIAVAILAHSEQVGMDDLESTLMLGELGLDGALRPIDGAVSAAVMAGQRGFKRLILPRKNAAEAAVVPNVQVFGLDSLADVVALLNGDDSIKPFPTESAIAPREFLYDIDFSDVKGQRHAVRALEIAAAGAHNVLMVGPPGSGKTMLARRLPTILPPLKLSEAIEVTRIWSSVGARGSGEGLIWERPFRAPHHGASHPAMVGGGKFPRPGEISMAHFGCLFLDEMPEFERPTLEALRQPLEDGIVTVSRASGSMKFPAECLLVGAMNPCPCGFKGLPEQKCVSSPTICGRYLAKLSGPLLDRIDLHIEVPRLKTDELLDSTPGESSEHIRKRVVAARERQTARLGPGKTNSRMTPRQIRKLAPLDADSESLMRVVAARMNLSGRVFDRIIKVARTIADLEGADQISKTHVAEAVQYRERDV